LIQSGKKAKNGNSTDGRVCCFAVESEEVCGNGGVEGMEGEEEVEGMEAGGWRRVDGGG